MQEEGRKFMYNKEAKKNILHRVTFGDLVPKA
jgi:hypothetical protein